MEKYSIGEVSEKTGVSIRTLRYYDQIGLLKPEKDKSSGHRIYTEKDLLTLHKIISLKFIGFRLDRIKDIIEKDTFDVSLKEQLAFEKGVLEQKREEIEKTIKTIEHVMELLDEVGEINSNVLMSIIRSMQTMEEQKEWMLKNFDQQVVEKIYENESEEKLKEMEKLIINFSKRVMDLYPRPVDDPEVQKMIREFLEEVFSTVDEEAVQILLQSGNLEHLGTSELAEIDKLSPSPFPKEVQAWLDKANEYYMKHSAQEIAEMFNRSRKEK